MIKLLSEKIVKGDSAVKQSKIALVAYTFLGSVLNFLGYFFGIIFLIILSVVVFDKEFRGMSEGIIFSSIMVGLSIFEIIVSINIKKRVKRFKRYISIISINGTNSLRDIANTTGKHVDYIKNDLQIMINKKFLLNAYIDEAKGEIFIGGWKKDAFGYGEGVDLENIFCPSCGALTVKPVGETVRCEFCGGAVK